MRTCINWKVVGGLSLVGLAVFASAPDLIGAALPLLVLAACPLAMLLMMRAMRGDDRSGSAGDATAGESRPGQADSGAEPARLRAEVDQLRAPRAEDDRGGARGTRPGRR